MNVRTFGIFWIAAAGLIAAPAGARDGSGYAGLEGGLLSPHDLRGDIAVTYPAGGTPQGSVSYNNGARLKAKKGYDADAIVGYDFGMFRVEGELGYKHSKLSGIRVSPQLLADLSSASVTTPPIANSDIDLVSPRANARTAMINGLLDFGAEHAVGGYAGVGVGQARVKRLTGSKTALSWQLIAGLRAPITRNVDAGLKYRYFSTGELHFRGEFDLGPASEFPYTAATKFRSHSLLASLIFNFGSSAASPRPVVQTKSSPPPPPATQICPDGLAIPATATCPIAPPPSLPAPPAERGERGK